MTGRAGDAAAMSGLFGGTPTLFRQTGAVAYGVVSAIGGPDHTSRSASDPFVGHRLLMGGLLAAKQRAVIQEQAQPSRRDVLTRADLDDVSTVRLLIGEHGDGGGVDVGDGPSVSVLQQLGCDGRRHIGHRKPPALCADAPPAGPRTGLGPTGLANQIWAARSMTRSAWASRSWAVSASSRVWATLVTACMTPPAVSWPPRMKWARIESATSSLNFAGLAASRTVSSGRVTGTPAVRSISVTLACK